VAPGVHGFTREIDGRIARYHLRVDPDGYGTLIANASRAARLSPSGVLLAHGVLSGDDRGAGARAARAFHGASRERVADDLATVQALVDDLALGRGAYPIEALDGPDATLHRRALGAPLCADLIVGEMATALELLAKLWDAAIPHVVLVPPDGASSADLPRLVERAEDLGLLCGARARATVVGDRLEAVAMAGLDHLDLFWGGAADHDACFGSGDRERAREVVAACHRLELCPTAVTPIVPATLGAMEAIAEELAELRVPAWTVFAVAEDGPGDDEVLGGAALRQAASTAEELADHFDLNLIWAPACERDPRLTLLEQLHRGPRASSGASLCVTADGGVLPKDGPAAPAGNLLHDRWEQIWMRDAFRSWREASADPERCAACPGLLACAAGCPADTGSWARAEGGAS
jgi:radical SAM protein with 4Fe4S-binding SPASM domain